MPNDTITRTSTIIIGTGFAGIGLGTKLRRSGNDDFVILERATDVGGTWRDNSYPGAACDIASHLYSFSFRLNPDWSHVYAPQREIYDYLKATAEEEGLLPFVRFATEVTSAEWLEDDQSWRVETTNGVYQAPHMVLASGHLSDPKLPDIRGLESFEGSIFHSAQWDHSIHLAGKRVGVIGTGASAIQIVPEVAKEAAHLTVFQRSAPYVVPRLDRSYTDAEKKAFRHFPKMMEDLRSELFWYNDSRFPQRRGVPSFVEKVSALALNHLEMQVGDPDLRLKLTPDYVIGCKRILLSNDYFPTFLRPNVDLFTEGIDRVEGSKVVGRDGNSVELDVLILSTGFEATDLPISHIIRGRYGRSLADAWSGGEQAFACSTVHGYPNMFIINGPNAGLGAGSVIYVIETQIDYVVQALDYLRSRGIAELEITEEAEFAYAAALDKRAQGTVWLSGGCRTWYVDDRNGRLTTLWPDYMHRFRRENGVFAAGPYREVASDSAPAPAYAG